MHGTFMPKTVEQWLAVAEFWYNTAHHSALGRSPFEVLYGQSPRQLGISNLQLCTVPDLEQWLKERELLSRLIQLQLHRAQQRMKAQADKHRVEKEFQVGDMVYMKLQPYVQSTVAARSNKKLSFRFYGPYKIMERVGLVAYKLQLPPGSKIHPVLHISQLKRHVPKETMVSEDLTSVGTDPLKVLQPERLLASRVIHRGNHRIKQVLVQWSSLPTQMATWEDEAEIPRHQVQESTA